MPSIHHRKVPVIVTHAARTCKGEVNRKSRHVANACLAPVLPGCTPFLAGTSRALSQTSMQPTPHAAPLHEHLRPRSRPQRRAPNTRDSAFVPSLSCRRSFALLLQCCPSSPTSHRHGRRHPYMHALHKTCENRPSTSARTPLSETSADTLTPCRIIEHLQNIGCVDRAVLPASVPGWSGIRLERTGRSTERRCKLPLSIGWR